MPKKPLKVLIVAGGARQQTIDFYDDTWKRWGINSIYNRIRAPWARMFNLHRVAHLARDVPQYVAWDAAYSHLNPWLPFYVVDSWGGLLKKQVLFPRRELEKMPRGDYHASSVDWMVALAVHEGAKMIAIHGARFALDGPGDEPVSAQACLEYWCGYATGKGVQIVVGSDSELFYQYHLVRSRSVYGYDDVRMVEHRRGR